MKHSPKYMKRWAVLENGPLQHWNFLSGNDYIMIRFTVLFLEITLKCYKCFIIFKIINA